MNALDPKLRRDLEKAIIKARDVAEEAAERALDRFAVSNPEPFSHMTVAERELRNKLRAKGRQLGDIKFETRKQSIHRLIAECAYEHWHQMLFARFLAENNRLMNSDNVPVTLAECEELASHEGAADGWILASRYASRMLPQIFRPDDAMLQVQFAPEHLHKLETILSTLPTDVFTADDSLGWVYQFWQSKKKDEVNKSENKIGADDLPAVTQLFTEDYMVLFLLHNTIGAWWTAQLLANGKISKEKWSKCASEDDCRRLVTTGAIVWEYLRFVKNEQTGEWKPAAGSFPGWPKRVRGLTMLDPCCGSGHFLVAAFIILVYLLMHEEGLSAQEASDVVLKNCLYGLEIDQRCTQIAAFALAFAAWKFPNAGGYRTLPRLNIACSGLSVGADKKEWLALANGDTRLNGGMERLYNLFEQAPTLGSLVSPKHIGQETLLEAGYDDLVPLLMKAMDSQKTKADPFLSEAGVAAYGLAQAAQFLARQYWLVATNVPYLAKRKQHALLRSHLETWFPLSHFDLATSFLERCRLFSGNNGTYALVTPQSWSQLGSYKHLRKMMLKEQSWNMIGRLGAKGFETPMWDFNVVLIAISNAAPSSERLIGCIDVSDDNTPPKKAFALKQSPVIRVLQTAQLNNPDYRIILDTSSENSKVELLSNHAYAAQGIGTTDNPRFVQRFWEQGVFSEEWERFQTASTTNEMVGGCHSMFRWGGEGSEYFEYIKQLKAQNRIGGGWQAGRIAWGRKGYAINVTGEKLVTRYHGTKFDTTIGVIVVSDETNLNPIYRFLASQEYSEELQRIDGSLSVTEATLVKAPFDLSRWQQVAEHEGGLPDNTTNDLTQWIFKGTVEGSTEPLQVSVARLLGYQWPGQQLDKFDKHANDDGVVGIPAIMREKPAAERLRELLAAAYGKEWSPAKEAELLHSVGYGDSNLEDWLRNGFFEQHCKLFLQRPFIWHIWDGRKDGFSVLVIYHKLNHQLLERITYTYLNDWIKRQEDGAARGEGGAETRLIAAKDLQKKLKLILEGEPPYDIFVRWKPIEQEPVGWNPDLNDGVRLNIRPFVEAEVLRKRPNINWNKDRGKDVESAPWYKVFKGERINDHHLTIKEKIEARAKREK